jgi:hypothetical protein
MNKSSYILILLLLPTWGFNQSITGSLSLLTHQPIKLEGSSPPHLHHLHSFSDIHQPGGGDAVAGAL